MLLSQGLQRDMQHTNRGLPGSRQRELPTFKHPMGKIREDSQNAKGHLQAVSIGALSTATELPSGGLGAICIAMQTALAGDRLTSRGLDHRALWRSGLSKQVQGCSR